MTFQASLRAIANSVRSIPGTMGVRPYRAFVVSRAWSGDEPGDGDPSTAETTTSEEITEANGQPPRIRSLNSEEIAVGGYDMGTWEIGPVTPDFPGGGTLITDVQRSGTGKSTLLHIRLVGPEFPNGANFRLKDVTSDRGYHYKFLVERSADS